MNRAILVFIVLVVAFIMLLLYSGINREDKSQPIVLKTSSGQVTSEFQIQDSMMFEASSLEPHTGYDIEIIREDGLVVSKLKLSTDKLGRIPETIIWYDIGMRACSEVLSYLDNPKAVFLAELSDYSFAGKRFSLNISKDGKVAKKAEFRVSKIIKRPRLYAADSRGCPKTGFLIGEEDVWVVGSDFPEGSIVRLWAVPANSEWKDTDALRDMTKQYGDGLAPLFELKGGKRGFKKLLWPKGLTSIGSYDIVAEVLDYPFGAYHATSKADALNVVSSLSQSGFVIQRRQVIGEPLEQDAAGVRMSRLAYRDSFLTTENVFVGVDPYVHPSYIGQTAHIYIVADKTDAQWIADTTLTDVTGTIESVNIQPGGCANAYSRLAWAAPLVPGKYDVVLDFNVNGVYDHGVDLIDSLDASGFVVSEVRVESISFDYAGASTITIYDNTAGSNITTPEYICGPCDEIKPAAWAMGSPATVQVNFKAAPSVNSAHIWALNGMGGLNSSSAPVTVNFSGGSGQSVFTAQNVPGYVGKHLFAWDWMYKNVNGSSTVEKPMGRTGEHLVYTLLDTPQAPQAIPWLEALDIAATLAYGRTTAADATRDIWEEFYLHAGGSYDTFSGAAQYTGSRTWDFNLTSWLANYKSGSIGTVNCYDMGKSVVIFSNALGANAVYTYVSSFGYLNCVKPIGKGWANNPFYDNPGYNSNPVMPEDSGNADGRSRFGNHGFTRVAGQIYDGSGGQVDADLNPDACTAVSARLLDGNDSWTSNYKNRVIDDDPSSSTSAPADYGFSVN